MFKSRTAYERRAPFKSRVRAIGVNVLASLLLAFCAYQFYTALRYGTIVPFARHHHGRPSHIHYSENTVEFVFSFIMWEFPLLIVLPFLILRSLGWREGRERGLVKTSLTRPPLEDEDKIVKYDPPPPKGRA